MDELKIIWTKIAISQRNEVLLIGIKEIKVTDFSKNKSSYLRKNRFKKIPLTGVEIQNEDAEFYIFIIIVSFIKFLNQKFIFWHFGTKTESFKLLEKILKLK